MAKKYKVDYYSFLGFIMFAFVIVFIWRFYYGYYILYPFTIMGTWFHEMGHGLTALIMGGEFLQLEIFTSGSGVATSRLSNPYLPVKIADALISAGGLLGPPITGAFVILMSKSYKSSKIVLYLLAISMLVSVVIWVKGPVGITIITCLGLLFLFIAIKAKPVIHQFVAQLIGIMACISTYRQLDYLFMGEATINGNTMLSDTGQIAAQLGLTYSFWGTLILIISFIMLVYSLYLRNRTRV